MTLDKKLQRVGHQLATEYIADLEAGRCPPRLRDIVAARRDALVRAVAAGRRASPRYLPERVGGWAVHFIRARLLADPALSAALQGHYAPHPPPDEAP